MWNVLLLPIQVDISHSVSDQDLQAPTALVTEDLEIYLLSLHTTRLASL